MAPFLSWYGGDVWRLVVPSDGCSFLAITIIIMFISGLSEKDVVNGFTHGASELVGVALIIGLARAVNIILDKG